MKLYQYEELRKLNQALGSFKRNKVPIENVEILAVNDKVVFFVLTDAEYEPRPDKSKLPKLKDVTKPSEVNLANKIKKGDKSSETKKVKELNK